MVEGRDISRHGRRVDRYREEVGGREGLGDGCNGIGPWGQRLRRVFIGCHRLRWDTSSVLVLGELEVCGLVGMTKTTQRGMRSSQL